MEKPDRGIFNFEKKLNLKLFHHIDKSASSKYKNKMSLRTY